MAKLKFETMLPERLTRVRWIYGQEVTNTPGPIILLSYVHIKPKPLRHVVSLVLRVVIVVML